LLDQPTEASLFSAGKAPSPLDSEMMKSRLESQPLRLKPRTSKSDAHSSIDDINQAGSRGVLVDKAGHPLYYSSYVTSDYYNFVRDNKLYIKANYVAASPTLNFPTKAVELKASWMIVPPGTPTDGYFTTPAFVPKLKCNSGGATCTGDDVVVDMTNEEKVVVALVGLHVVGVLEGHPEFVWATFEHVKNAPNLPAGADPSGNAVVDTNDWTFYAKGTTAAQCNQWVPASVSLDPTKQLLSPSSNVFRQFASGGGASDDTANIQSLNASVQSQLDANSVWKNYFLGGGVWFGDGSQLKPGLGGGAIQALTFGSINISNSTMETFTQTIGAGGKKNCFSCHNTLADGPNGVPAMNLNVSHILKQGLINREQLSQLAKLNISHKNFLAMDKSKRNLSDVAKMSPSDIQALAPPNKTVLKSYADVQAFLDKFVADNNVRINSAPHGPFWRSMNYVQFTTGNIPNVGDPNTGAPLPVMVNGNSKQSNIIQALLGATGTIFDPNTGAIGQMPPGGPFMPPQDVMKIAQWIDAGAPN
jgi:hypothetical protein